MVLLVAMDLCMTLPAEKDALDNLSLQPSQGRELGQACDSRPLLSLPTNVMEGQLADTRLPHTSHKRK